jgi:predicted metal-binding membrane protein
MPAGASAPAPANARSVAFRALFVALSAAAWSALWLWSSSPYARYVDHGRWTEAALLASLCSTLPGGALWLPAVLYAGGWLLMIAAMMLPTTLPVLDVVRRMTRGEPGRRGILSLLVAAYVAAWLVFGVAAHLADLLVHAGAARVPWLIANGWALGAAVLATAGLFQFSRLKYRCLDQCHTPLAFVLQRWHGESRERDALRVGWDHGLFCIGCCWALMLIMFVVGTGSLGWMIALAAVMAAEKNLPGGRRLRTPLGLALLGWAAAIVLSHILPSA